ncbi:MAG TPA: hypothetical protein DCQ06_13420 [Myxococcales bacterium]|nr:hypothetical protein [Myxococcales bacterium]
MAKVRGDLVVLIHSDRDCSNVLPKTAGRIHAHHPAKFLCTNMTEDEMVTGQGNRKLRRSIELIAQSWKPELVVVLSTCPTVMIGDNIKNVTRKAARELGIRAVAEITHGLKPKSPAEVVDKLYCTLSRAAPSPETPPTDTVALAGISLRPAERAELEVGFEKLGLKLVCVLDDRAELDDFLRLRQASLLIHPGPNMLLKLVEQVQSWGVDTVEVPLPFGVRATDDFWEKIASATGRSDWRQRLSTWRDPAIKWVESFQQRREGRSLRAAYNIGSVRSFDLRRIALEELGELTCFDELGFDSQLFIQGPQHEDNWDRTKQVLVDLGVERNFILFPDPGGLVHFLEKDEYDLFFGARFLKDQVTQVNLPLVDNHSLTLGYGGVAENIEAIDTALDDRFYEHFSTRVHSPGDTEGLEDAVAAGHGQMVDEKGEARAQ